jgi:hypothetical protein
MPDEKHKKDEKGEKPERPNRRYRRTPPNGFPKFDPQESLDAGLELLEEAGVPFALVGRLAVWIHVPAEAQAFTKDVDFAVTEGGCEVLARVARERGYEVLPLGIGGYGVNKGRVHIDFVHRAPYLADLFAEAIKAAEEQAAGSGGADAQVEGAPIPVAPVPFLIATKVGLQDAKNERDVVELLRVTPEDEYPAVRELVHRHIGFAGRERLDHLARSIGHPGVERPDRYGRTPEGKPPSD